MNLNKHDENAINEFQTSNIWNHENILPLILVHVFTKPFEMKGYVPALPVALEIFSFAFQFSSTTKKNKIKLFRWHMQIQIMNHLTCVGSLRVRVRSLSGLVSNWCSWCCWDLEWCHLVSEVLYHLNTCETWCYWWCYPSSVDIWLPHL